MLSSKLVAQQNSSYTGYSQQNSVDDQPFNPGVLLILIIGAMCAIMVLFKAK
jgi:hypothetical protein